MATLTHMSTGGLMYERAVLNAVKRCVTTQLFLFDRPSKINVNNEDAEKEQKKNKEKKPKQKKGNLDTTSKTFFDGRHDTLISGISGFVSQTGHSEILTPVAHIIGKWVSQVANEWIYAENFIQQSNAWESKELFKYMKLATAACSFSATALHFGSELKMMTVLHELWDPTPDSSSSSSNGGWFGLRHLDSHVEVKDKRLSGKRMIKCIKKMQHATIGKYREWSTVVDISITYHSFKTVLLSFSSSSVF